MSLETVLAPAGRVRRPRRRPTRHLRHLPAALLLVVAVCSPWLERWDPRAIVGPPSQPPSGEFWFGTDASGFDVFSRVVAATREDLSIAVSVTLITTALGILLGLLIGMNESRRDLVGALARATTRALELLEAFPAILVGLIVVALYNASTVSMIIAISVIILPLQARLVRTEVLKARSDGYVEAARVGGQSEARLIVRHVLPNSTAPALDNTPFVFGVAVILIAALGFLGVGVPPPTPEWGSMIAGGTSDAAVGRWWPATFPTLALIAAVAAVALTRRAPSRSAS
jgi:peptide/nickel transport system permease protein